MTSERMRVTVALDPAAPRQEVFEAIVTLCGSDGADITALFVEDDNLTRLATLPGARQVITGGAPRAQDLDAAIMHRQLAMRAASVRRTCERAIARLDLRPARFEVRHGEVISELARGSIEAELLIVGRSLRSAAARSWLGADPARLEPPPGTQHTPQAVLFVHEPWRTGSSVVAVVEDGEIGLRSAARAEALARRDGLTVELLRVGESLPNADALSAACLRFDARVLVLSRAASGDVRMRVELLRKVAASVLLIC